MEENRVESIFNYVLGLYGHYPFMLNESKRPRLIDASVPPGVSEEKVERVANQIFYRSEAVGAFVAKVNQSDPTAIIIVLGDHLPDLERAKELNVCYGLYERLGYLKGTPDPYKWVPVFAMSGGKPLSPGNISHHHLPEVILNLLTNGDFCKTEDCFMDRFSYYERYLNIMAEGVASSD